MDLADDDPLGTVDDESAAIGHQRDVAEKYLTLAELAGGGEFQSNLGLDRYREGPPLALAFHLGKLAVLKIDGVAVIVQAHLPVLAFDGECRLEHLL
ncbi:hypothetical protein SDC9_203339 [bioreactor metagenome]|uniref:Uncharacterized protein n=1 Tax=bioreactor metagenome TaxID=1076179 RepID=A0A645IW61_9ZZZZ